MMRTLLLWACLAAPPTRQVGGISTTSPSQSCALISAADAAQVSFEEGLTERRVSGETIRATLAKLGVHRERAKRWIESPDPEYARKKGPSSD